MTKRPAFFEAIKYCLRPTVKAIMEQIHPAEPSGPVEQDVCEFAEVLEFSVGLRRKHPGIASVLLKRERRDDRWLLTHVLLDENERLVRKGKALIGRKLLIKSFDDELSDLFDEAESIVIGLPTKETLPQESEV